MADAVDFPLLYAHFHTGCHDPGCTDLRSPLCCGSVNRYIRGARGSVVEGSPKVVDAVDFALLEFRVQGSGSRVQGAGSRVQDSPEVVDAVDFALLLFRLHVHELAHHHDRRLLQTVQFEQDASSKWCDFSSNRYHAHYHDRRLLQTVRFPLSPKVNRDSTCPVRRPHSRLLS